MNSFSLRQRGHLDPGEPLWKRAPTRGADGQLLSDFIMLIPKLGTRSTERIRAITNELQAVFDYYRETIVFADLNLRLNVLWVSVRPVPGITLELATAIKLRIPEAVLVANRVEALLASRGGRL